MIGERGPRVLQHRRRAVVGVDRAAREAAEDRAGQSAVAAAELDDVARRRRDQAEQGFDLLLAVGHEDPAVIDEGAAVVLVPAR